MDPSGQVSPAGGGRERSAGPFRWGSMRGYRARRRPRTRARSERLRSRRAHRNPRIERPATIPLRICFSFGFTPLIRNVVGIEASAQAELARDHGDDSAPAEAGLDHSDISKRHEEAPPGGSRVARGRGLPLSTQEMLPTRAAVDANPTRLREVVRASGRLAEALEPGEIVAAVLDAAIQLFSLEAPPLVCAILM